MVNPRLPNWSSSQKCDDSSRSNTPNTQKGQSHSDTSDSSSLSSVSCRYCKKQGHEISECYTLKRKEQKDAKPTALVSSLVESQPRVNTDTFVDVPKAQSDSTVVTGLQPFISEGFISLPGDSANPTPIKILRDTACVQSLILQNVLPFSDKSFTGKYAIINGVECGGLTVPLHNISLTSDVVSGTVAVGIRPILPVEGVDLLLGNDLAGDKVVVYPLVTDKPSLDSSPDPIEEEFPDLFPSCTVTRAMAKKAIENDLCSDVDDNIISFGHLFDTEVDTPLHDSQTESKLDSKARSLSTDHSLDTDSDTGKMSRSHLITEQQRDPGISVLFDRALSEEEGSQVPVVIFCEKMVF